MYTPRIAITVGTEGSEKGYGNYIRRIEEAGAVPVIAGPDCDPESLVDTIDALLVTGGTDVDPVRYGESPVAELLMPDVQRDEFELALLKVTMNRDKPVLAICRGHQILNIAFGGRLQQHIPGDAHRAGTEPPFESRYHDVSIEDGSVLAGLLGTGTRRVNSRHHQAVRSDMIGDGLLCSATSPDGLVEGLESPNHRFVVGVQWHPERPEVEEDFRSLFSALVTAARDTSVPAR